MIDDEVKAVIIAVIIVGGALSISQIVLSERVSEPFSALGLLGPNMKIGDYPKTVLVNQTVNLYLFIDNHEGRTIYYIIYVKLGDKLTEISENKSAEAPILYTYEVILPHGMNTTIPVSLKFSNPMTNARLIFEMWIYDSETRAPRYHGRWNQLWLNITAPTIA